MKKKKQSWFTKVWVLNETWTKAFFLSHLFGWITAFIQTIWIVIEVRRKKKL